LEAASIMKGSLLRCPVRWLVVALVASAGTCSIDPTGLGPQPDGSAAGASGSVVWCPAGLTDQAAWPAKTSYTSCVRPCGPEGSGIQTCGQTDRATCLAKSGCLCLEAPCVTCGACAFLSLSDCYRPSNAATATLCADGVTDGTWCSPACSKRLCLQGDGKTGCMCGSQGRYACAEWNGSSWQ
jgi:hypothetical protein